MATDITPNSIFADPSVEGVVKEKPDSTEAKTFRVIVEHITRKEAAASRKAGLREKKCVILLSVHLPRHFYQAAPISDDDTLIENAFIYSVGEAIQLASDNDILCILDSDLIAKEPPRPKFTMEHYMDSHMASLIRNSPNNPMVRSLLMARFGKKPPEDCKEYAAIKNWIELNCAPPGEARNSTRSVPASAFDWAMDTAGVIDAARRPVVVRETPPAIIVEVEVEVTEMGTCHYRLPRSGTARIRFSEAELIGILEEDGFVEAVNTIVDESNNQASEAIDDWSEEDYIYNNYDSVDSETDRLEAITNVRPLIIQWARNNLSEERRRELGIPES